MKKSIIACALALASLAATAQSSEALLLCAAAERRYGPDSPVTARFCGTAYAPPARQSWVQPQPQQPAYVEPRPTTTECRYNESTRVVRCVTR